MFAVLAKADLQVRTIRMEKEAAINAFNGFLARKQDELGCALAVSRETPERLSAGWAFYYQSRAYLETGNLGSLLVGQGPVVVKDDETIVEGGSLDVDLEALLAR